MDPVTGGSAFSGFPWPAKYSGGYPIKMTLPDGIFAYWKVRTWRIRGTLSMNFLRYTFDPPTDPLSVVTGTFNGEFGLNASQEKELVGRGLQFTGSYTGSYRAYHPLIDFTETGHVNLGFRLWPASVFRDPDLRKWKVDPVVELGIEFTGLEYFLHVGYGFSVGAGLTNDPTSAFALLDLDRGADPYPLFLGPADVFMNVTGADILIEPASFWEYVNL